jgi:hypothetical protein
MSQSPTPPPDDAARLLHRRLFTSVFPKVRQLKDLLVATTTAAGRHIACESLDNALVSRYSCQFNFG